jgi:dTDP-4-amino-4,6-dideoxy-D-galactose acyltransferase
MTSDSERRTASGTRLRRLSQADSGRILEFLSTSGLAASIPTYGLNSETQLKIEMSGISRILQHEEGLCLGAFRNGSIEGLACLMRAAFDSSVYQLEMGEVSSFLAHENRREATLHGSLLRCILRSASKLGIEHLSCRIPVDDVAARHALELAGFLLMDTSVEYSWNPTLIEISESEHSLNVRTPATSPGSSFRILKLGVTYRPSRSEDLPALEEIARRSFTQDTLSRYSVDPALPLERTGNFYARWINNAVRGSFGDLVMVACAGERPVGFQAFRREAEFSELLGVPAGSMGIGAIDPNFRGGGIFPGLMATVLAWCGREGIRLARGRTLVNNFRMHRTCAATGGTIRACFHSFHRTLGRAAKREPRPSRLSSSVD